MRFGMFVPQGWRLDLAGIDPVDHWSTMLGVVQRAEAGPWESVWVYDHFHTVPLPSAEATHEAWTLMAALGATTSRVRLGQMCTCMGYRNPAYLAKVAATIDVISGGRVEMGIGAGWYEHEWRAYGYGFPGAGDRLAALDEGVQIMRQMWTEGVATLNGKHFQVDGAIGRPLPLQEGGIPLWIAGGGERKTLRTAAQYASYTNFDGGLEAFKHKSEVLAKHCLDLGRDFAEITRSANFNIVIGATQADVDDRLGAIHDHVTRYAPSRADATLESFRNGPLVGTPEQLIERLQSLEKAGMTYAICYFTDAAYDPASIDLFEREVVPAFAR